VAGGDDTTQQHCYVFPKNLLLWRDSNPDSGLLFSAEKGLTNIGQKWVGLHFGRFLTDSSGHPEFIHLNLIFGLIWNLCSLPKTADYS
jgi:hypothetical protein